MGSHVKQKPYQKVNTMANLRLFYYDSSTGYYQTGSLNPGAPAGQQCLSPDPQSFTSIEDMISYADATGESLQEATSVEQVNAMCSGSYVSPYAMSVGGTPGAGCPCLCIGGGMRTNPNVSPPADAFFGANPEPQSVNSFDVQRQIINRSQRGPVPGVDGR